MIEHKSYGDWRPRKSIGCHQSNCLIHESFRSFFFPPHWIIKLTKVWNIFSSSLETTRDPNMQCICSISLQITKEESAFSLVRKVNECLNSEHSSPCLLIPGNFRLISYNPRSFSASHSHLVHIDMWVRICYYDLSSGWRVIRTQATYITLKENASTW